MKIKITSLRRRLFFLILGVLITWASSHFLRKYSADTNNNLNTPLWQEYNWDGLYTSVRLVMHHPEKSADSIQRQIANLFKEITEEVRTQSPLDSAIQRGKIGDTLRLKSHLCVLFRYGEEQFALTQGRIHPGIGNLLHSYGLVHGKTPRLPHPDTLAREKQRLRTLFYRMIPGECAMVLQDSLARFALGAFAKGYALDRGADLLDSFQVQRYYLEAGGDLVVRDLNLRGVPWAIGIQDPDLEKGILGYLSLGGPGKRVAMASSGGYRKFFVDSASGKHYHHILDPVQGLPVDDKKSTTAIADRAIDADLWATYLFVMPFSEACAGVKEETNIKGMVLSQKDSLCMGPTVGASWKK